MLVLVVYFPVGFLLAVLRMFIGFHAFIAACVLPKSSFLRRFVSCISDSCFNGYFISEICGAASSLSSYGHSSISGSGSGSGRGRGRSS